MTKGRLHIKGDYYVQNDATDNSGSSPSSPNSPLTNLITAMSNSIGGISNKTTITEFAGSSSFSNNISTFLSGRSNNVSYPKAYLQWVLFDEQFNYVSGSSGAQQVGASGSLNVLSNTSGAISLNVPGKNTLHEVVESYEGGKIAQNTGISTGQATVADEQNPNSVYSRSHRAAPNQAGAISYRGIDKYGNVTTATSGPNAAVKVENFVKEGNRPEKIIHTVY